MQNAETTVEDFAAATLTGRWADLPASRWPDARMPEFHDAYQRWLAWVDGNARPVAHRGRRDVATGGVTHDGVNPWSSPALVPGDLVSIDGGPVQDYTAAVDAGVRRTVDLVNRYVGATIASCEGHGNDARNAPSTRRFVRVAADSLQGIDRATAFMTDVVAGQQAADTPGVAVTLTRRNILVETNKRVPSLTVHFLPTGLGEAAYWDQLDRATKALEARIVQHAARESIGTAERGATTARRADCAPVSASVGPRQPPGHRVAASGIGAVKPRKPSAATAPMPKNAGTPAAAAAYRGSGLGIDKAIGLGP